MRVPLSALCPVYIPAPQPSEFASQMTEKIIRCSSSLPTPQSAFQILCRRNSIRVYCITRLTVDDTALCLLLVHFNLTLWATWNTPPSAEPPDANTVQMWRWDRGPNNCCTEYCSIHRWAC